MRKKILLLGSGELGKEFVIACQRLGQYVVAVDSYEGAPAMQVAHEFEVINMLDAHALDAVVDKHSPDIIVPEIEAIRTEQFYAYEQAGIQVVPSAKAANFTMNRKAIRDLAAIELGVRTAPYRYATTFEELKKGIEFTGIPCVVKPLMSSSGKGQSVIKTESDIEKAWQYAMEGSRGDLREVIVEGFIDFDYEITLLTVTQANGMTLFCPPIGHRQERGDYQESWQPMPMDPEHLKEAQEMARKVTSALGGNGIWGVEFFITREGAYFSELSPRPHDTGIAAINLERNGASAVVLAHHESSVFPSYVGVIEAAQVPNTDFKIFGKPSARPYRRMAVALAYGSNEVSELVTIAKSVAEKIKVK
ncbi:MAG: formate-dependent phosphoribosylglycinamide formyltransferase [Flavobacteriales bacterium]|nr:formate-dependent phosphoribosylglycinamide formyltransferase [Flavobacteriales bacterium]